MTKGNPSDKEIEKHVQKLNGDELADANYYAAIFDCKPEDLKKFEFPCSNCRETYNAWLPSDADDEQSCPKCGKPGRLYPATGLEFHGVPRLGPRLLI